MTLSPVRTGLQTRTLTVTLGRWLPAPGPPSPHLGQGRASCLGLALLQGLAVSPRSQWGRLFADLCAVVMSIRTVAGTAVLSFFSPGTQQRTEAEAARGSSLHLSPRLSEGAAEHKDNSGPQEATDSAPSALRNPARESSRRAHAGEAGAVPHGALVCLLPGTTGRPNLSGT